MSSKRDIIVVGASAGGVEALKTLVVLLPSDLPAAIFVVLHIPGWRRSELPAILSHNGLPALHPRADQPIMPGRVYVAPPDYHMVLGTDRVQLWRGPKENLHRPAINPLFRSAAVNFKERVVGIVLSGSSDDGSAGLWWVKEYGGLAVVQEPGEAKFPQMPESAIEHVAVDYVLKLREMAELLKELTDERSSIRTNRRQQRR